MPKYTRKSVTPNCWCCGNPVSQEDFKEKVTDVNGWSCGHCRTAARKGQFQDGPKGLAVLKIFMDMNRDSFHFVQDVITTIMEWKKAEAEAKQPVRQMRPEEENQLPRNLRTAFTSKDARTDITAEIGWHGGLWRDDN